jgi:hypothetical protein
MRLPRNAHDPISCRLSMDEIFTRAAAFGKEWNFTVGTLTASLLAVMGGKTAPMNEAVDVILGSMPSEHSDCLVAYGKEDFLILLLPSSDANSPRTNFDIARCLGHVVLHLPVVQREHGKQAGMIVRHYASTKAEKACQIEANQFAIGLLAPPDRLLEEWKRTDGDIRQLREIFKVPGDLIKGLQALYSEREASSLCA